MSVANSFLLKAALSGISVVALLLGAAGPVRLAPGDEERHVILHQRGGQPVAKVVANAAHLDSLPLDGTSMQIPASGKVLLSGEVCTYEEIAASLAPVKGAFHRCTRNMVVIHTRGFPDVFDDWSMVLSNWRNLARAAEDAGLIGIMFDNETYREKVWRHPDDVRYPAYSLQQYQAQMRRRGREVMEVVAGEFPEVVFLVFHGPYISEPKTPQHVTLLQAVASERDLRGPFFAGLVEGAPDSATVVDGGEVYQYRTPEDFARSYEWRKWEIASDETDCAFIPRDLRGKWVSRVSIGFGVYNRQWKKSYPMDPQIMRATLENALRATDNYVWLYVESEWTAPGEVSPDWLNAVSGAVQAVRDTQTGTAEGAATAP
jgi:hypothetical protein